jgi:hypothetical protein
MPTTACAAAQALVVAAGSLMLWGCSGSSGPPPTPRSTLPDDSQIQWSQADSLAIQTNSSPEAWNAGHVNGIVKLDQTGNLAVAAESGGVWTLSSKQQALPLSYSWNSVFMTSLAVGPSGPGGSANLYAGTSNSSTLADPASPSSGGVLWETDTSTAAPMLNWSQVQKKPACGTIWKIVVINVPRTGDVIVLACDTGLWWSAIPPPPSIHGTYQWNAAIAAPDTLSVLLSAPFTSLTEGPRRGDSSPTIVASTQTAVQAPPGEIIAVFVGWLFWGEWSGGNLLLHVASVDLGSGGTFGTVGRTSVASCAQDLTDMYAVAADTSNNQMAGVWRSKNGGHSWSLVTLPPNAGGQGWYNNIIAVASDCHATAVGWQNGTFVSYDAGQSWTNLTDNHGNLHADVHALTFDPADPTTLYIGSDGGMVAANGIVQGATPTYDSSYNRQLFDMQLYRGGGSPRVDGLVAAALQDNGVLAAKLPGAWHGVSGSDGANANFASLPNMAPGTDLLIEGSFGGTPFYGPLKEAKSNASGSPLFGSAQGIDVGNSSNNLADNAEFGIVRTPAYANSAGQQMYAVAGLNQIVYGLFANPDGGKMHWEVLGFIGSGQNVTSVTSDDGFEVFVGTDAGAIYELLSGASCSQSVSLACATVLQLAVDAPQPGTGSVDAMVAFAPPGSSAIAFAVYNVNGTGYVLRWTGQTFHAVGGSRDNNLPYTAIDAIATGGGTVIFLASNANVYSSYDFGDSWRIASDGLPFVAQAVDMHAIHHTDGKSYVYLSTYGWSLWRAVLPF